MKPLFAATVLATLALSLAVAQETGSKVAQDAKAKDEVRKLREQWGQAVLARDEPAVERLLADEFTLTDPNGKVHDRKAYLATVRPLALESGKVEDEKIRVYGDIAVVTVRVTLRGKSNDVDISGSFREMDVLAKRDGRWQCVAVQQTRITQP